MRQRRSVAISSAGSRPNRRRCSTPGASATLRGREIAWEGGSGVAEGIDDRGYLVVVSGGERVVLGAGEVHLTRV